MNLVTLDMNRVDVLAGTYLVNKKSNYEKNKQGVEEALKKT